MAKSRVEKNQKLYEALDEEMKNNKGDLYEEKLKAIDPSLENEINVGNFEKDNEKLNKKNEVKSTSALTVIAKEIKGKRTDKNDVVTFEEKNTVDVNDEEIFNDPISFTDKLSIEEILRAKIENQEKIKNQKKEIKKGPNDDSYTPEMMQERINQHEGVDVRKEAQIVTKDHRWIALFLLFVALISIIIVGILLVFKVIK